MFRMLQQSSWLAAAWKERPQDAAARARAARCAAPAFVAHDSLAIVKGRVDAAGARGETGADAFDARAWRAMSGYLYLRELHESKLA
ncbi:MULTISPECIES: hypothetical protein [unclassified Burkholderia]|uniref:hypothetical protein n=1 Tax=unclassified Burkholderia TaxID=2613784 RepID=UPI001F11B5E6|nr:MULTISPECIES: hypothetical protein [unclassified Burkholderia]